MKKSQEKSQQKRVCFHTENKHLSMVRNRLEREK